MKNWWKNIFKKSKKDEIREDVGIKYDGADPNVLKSIENYKKLVSINKDKEASTAKLNEATKPIDKKIQTWIDFNSKNNNGLG